MSNIVTMCVCLYAFFYVLYVCNVSRYTVYTGLRIFANIYLRYRSIQYPCNLPVIVITYVTCLL